jgi:hypothetical protein
MDVVLYIGSDKGYDSWIMGVLKMLGNNHKNMINRVQEFPLSIMITRKSNGLRETV